MRGFPDATMASKLLPYFSILFTCLVILVCFRPLYKRVLDRFFKFSQPKTVPNREKQDTIFSAVERLVGMFPFQLIQKFKNWIREFKSKKLNPRGLFRLMSELSRSFLVDVRMVRLAIARIFKNERFQTIRQHLHAIIRIMNVLEIKKIMLNSGVTKLKINL